MASSRISGKGSAFILTLFVWLFRSVAASAVPLADRLSCLGEDARDVLRTSVPAAPHFVVYNDAYVDPFPSASQLSGFNVFAIAFLLASGPVDQAEAWLNLTPDKRKTLLQEYNAAGITLIVSAFGETDSPTSSGYDPVKLANTMAAWVKQYGLQGIDVDYEDFTAFRGVAGTAEPWLINFTQQLRRNLPQGQYILTHAPVAPWFSPNMWSGGGYLAVHRKVGDSIDWYNVQFYNQGTSEYTTCSGLLTKSSANFPESALFQIVGNGVPPDKLLIGKPGTTRDAHSGFMSTTTLASCIAQAFHTEWNGGIMVWEFPGVDSSWIQGISRNMVTIN